MSEKIIPEHIDCFRFAEQELELTGKVKLSEMARLSTMIPPQNAFVSVVLQFAVDEQSTPYLKGHLETMLSLECQRCMGPFNYEIIADFLLGMVETLDEANDLPGHYDPVLAKEGQLPLRELIEDEIILNLPIIARHEQEDCKIKLPVTDEAWGEENGENPFRVLESLKHKHK